MRQRRYNFPALTYSDIRPTRDMYIQRKYVDFGAKPFRRTHPNIFGRNVYYNNSVYKNNTNKLLKMYGFGK